MDSNTRRFVVVAFFFVFTTPSAQQNSGFPSLGPPSIKLTRAIKLDSANFSDPTLSFDEESPDGFPAFGLQPGSNVSAPATDLFPATFPPQFSLTATVKLKSPQTGYLFAVVDGSNEVVQLGMEVTPAGPGASTVTLYHTQPGQPSQPLVSFPLASDLTEWTRFGLSVRGAEATVYLNCAEAGKVPLSSVAAPLQWDPQSTLYLGQAGPRLNGNLDVLIQELEVSTSTEFAEKQCVPINFDNLNKVDDFDYETTTTAIDMDFPSGDPEEDIGNNETPPPPPPPLPPSFTDLKEDKEEKPVEGPIGPPGPPGQCSCNISEILESLNISDPEPGPPGERGLPGEKGEIGPMGPEGPPGAKGEPGIPGTPAVPQEGKPGPKGEPGLDGLPGSKGPKGPQGSKGTKGDKGKTGAQGPKGTKGDVGKDGKDGQPGTPGENGKPGSKGEKGDVGLPGPPGLSLNTTAVAAGNGSKGSSGSKGEKGAKGDVGPIGEKGSPGVEGPPGTPGERGPPGTGNEATLKGEKGDRGRRGKPGPPGPKGDMGLPGFTGPPGAPGASCKGQKGEPGQVVINTATQGVDTTPSYITTSSPYIPVPGPPGPSGMPGLSIQGEKGEPGVPGKCLCPKNSIERPGDTRLPSSPSDDYGGDRLPTVRFRNIQDLHSRGHLCTLGTLAFVLDDQILLLRISVGWQHVSMGQVVPLRDNVHVVQPSTHPTTTTTSTSTTTERPQPSFNTTIVDNNVQKPPPEGLVLRLAALNEPYSGGMKGSRGADYACYKQSRRAGLRGTFRALLSSRIQNIDSIVRYTDWNLPVVNIKGEILFEAWGNIFSNKGNMFIHSPKIYSFKGRDILTDPLWPKKYVWHGSLPTGERSEVNCDAWESDEADRLGLASPLESQLLGEERLSCDLRLAVLCVEVTSRPGRRRRDITSEDDYRRLLTELQTIEND